MVTPQATTDEAKLSVVVGQFQTYTAAEHAWTVEKTVDDETVSLRVGELPKTLNYKIKVTKLPPSDAKYFVSGKINIMNTGTQPVDLSAVSVTAGEAAVPATCPPDARQAQPSVPVVCSFNVSWNNGAVSGSLGARVDTPKASFTGPPASFDFTQARQGAARGAKADVFDDIAGKAPAGAAGVPDKWFVADGSEPPAKAEGFGLTTADSREYSYTVQVGPFADKRSCGTYTLSNTATVVPSDAPGLTVTDAAVVSVSVTGCGADEVLLSTEAKGDVVATLADVKTVRLLGNQWAVNGSAVPPSVSLKSPGESAPAKFGVTFAKVPMADYQVTGTVNVVNANRAAASQLASLTVALESTSAGLAKTVDAVCGGAPLPVSLPPGGTLQCKFTANVSAPAAGDAIAVTADGTGRTVESAPVPFSFDAAQEVAAENAPSCALALSVRFASWRHPSLCISARLCGWCFCLVPASVCLFVSFSSRRSCCCQLVS